MIFLAEHDEFLAILADEESVDRLFVSAIFEQHCRAACQAGGDNDHALPSAALFFFCLEFDLVLMQADIFRPGASLRQVAAAVKAGLFYFFRSTRFRLHFFCISFLKPCFSNTRARAS
ncbi:hypothetical protein C7S14_4692 [Burkholderia cepacia]|nr:hypothetical protein C7S14_4692 [Burkholderia cepacia]